MMVQPLTCRLGTLLTLQAWYSAYMHAWYSAYIASFSRCSQLHATPSRAVQSCTLLRAHASCTPIGAYNLML